MHYNLLQNRQKPFSVGMYLNINLFLGFSSWLGLTAQKLSRNSCRISADTAVARVRLRQLMLVTCIVPRIVKNPSTRLLVYRRIVLSGIEGGVREVSRSISTMPVSTVTRLSHRNALLVYTYTHARVCRVFPFMPQRWRRRESPIDG